MDKAHRKKILHRLAAEELAGFKNTLPVDERIFPELFDFIDEELSEQGCHNDFAIAGIFCDKRNIDKQKFFSWLNEQGVACDCEILNLEGSFEYLDASPAKPIDKPQVKKQKLNSLKTDFGFYIDKIPSPWILTETILNDKPVYTFQIGKSNDCIVTLENSFPAGQLNNDKYWLDLWMEETVLSRNLEDLAVERPGLENFTCILVKTKNWIPVLVWCKSNLTDKWSLKMGTGLSRYKGDLKELSRLLINIQVGK